MKLFALFIALSILSACGGGGGPVSAPPDYCKEALHLSFLKDSTNHELIPSNALKVASIQINSSMPITLNELRFSLHCFLASQQLPKDVEISVKLQEYSITLATTTSNQMGDIVFTPVNSINIQAEESRTFHLLVDVSAFTTEDDYIAFSIGPKDIWEWKCDSVRRESPVTNEIYGDAYIKK